MNETNDLVLTKNENDVFDISLNSDGDFVSDNFMDTSLMRSIYAEKRASASEMTIPEMRRGWIGNLYKNYEDGSKVWLFEQAQLNRKTLNGLKTEIENALLWLITSTNKAALGYTVSIETDNDSTMFARISIQKNSDKTESYFYKLFENSGKTL